MAVEFSFLFPLVQGLHARPASVIREHAERFPDEISWDNLRNGTTADAKSVLSLIGSDTLHDDPCRIRIHGPSEQGALADLRLLIEEELPKRETEAEAAQIASLSQPSLPRILTLERALYFLGVPGGAGVVRGPVSIYDPILEWESGDSSPRRSPEDETAAYVAATLGLETDWRGRLKEISDPTERAVIEAHLAILRDRAFSAKVTEFIVSEECGAAEAVRRTGRAFGGRLQASRSLYIRERLADIKDVTRELIARLSGIPSRDTGVTLTEPAVLVAADLLPSQFLALKRDLLLGLVLESAGLTSHTLIMCRARGIPAVTGCAGIRQHLQTGEDVFVDGGRGLVVPVPAPPVARYFEREIEAERLRRARRKELASLSGTTADGRRVEIAANIGDPEEMEGAWADGAEAIGLFRTELLLMGRSTPPDEGEQYEVYAQVIRNAAGRPVIVRTFDIGGDKPISFLPLPAESNPFLGERGIRLYDRFENLVRSQVRALLRAADLGPLKIMFPMVSTPEEVLKMKDLLGRVRDELAAEGVPRRPDVEIGIMVEVPSAALLIDRLSEQVDFFSVGSNDLLQYFFAADRGHPSVRRLNEPAHPAFLRFLKSAVDDAHARGKWIGLCGEMAASRPMLPLLIGLGFDELSMTSNAIPGVKAGIRDLNQAECRRLLLEASGLSRASDVEALLVSFAAERGPGAAITSALVRLRSGCTSRVETLQEFAAMMEAAGRTDDHAAFESALWQREDTFSTGIGFGVAIPHCQTPNVSSASVALLRFATAFDWDGGGAVPVDLAVMLAFPSGREASPDHLKLLARLSRRLAHDEFRDALRAAENADAVVAVILEALGESPAPKQGGSI